GPEAKDSADHRIMPDIAEKWEYTSPTTVVFTLRKGVRFHKKPPVNGREVTAEDVKFSLDRFRAKSPVRSRLEPVQSVDVLDRYTVRLVLREPFAPLLNHLANPAHWWGWLTPEEGRALKRTNPEMVIATQMVVDLAHVYMRTDQPPFSDVRVRRAVALAIDRKAWRTSLHFGEGCLDSGPVPCS